MQTLPEAGKTYISKTDPALILFVETVEPIEEEGGFIVNACPPDAIDDMTAMGYEFINDEWEEHHFIPYTPS